MEEPLETGAGAGAGVPEDWQVTLEIYQARGQGMVELLVVDGLFLVMLLVLIFKL
jgi:hypothetical protein